ncbi:MAG: hypothetical protein LBV08_07805 [Clostridiales bacterium]|jgi:uncharacterized DUF497 family protein|nr:hypothetical protein [Clostridiales bacterium]
MQCKIKMIHFAWDKEKDSTLILKKLLEFKNITKLNMRSVAVYVLVNFDTNFEFNLQRIYTLRDYGFTPYVMIYEKEKAEQKYKHLARWVNSKVIFRTVNKFADYNPRLH